MFETCLVENIVKQFLLTAAFAQYEWEKLLDLGDHYYPDLVIQFYANMSFKGNKSSIIETRVNQRNIVLLRL